MLAVAGPLRACLERLGLKARALDILARHGVDWASSIGDAASARHEEQRHQPGTTSARYSCLTTTLSACDARAQAGMHSGMWLRMGSAGKAREGSTGHAVDDQGTWLEN